MKAVITDWYKSPSFLVLVSMISVFGDKNGCTDSTWRYHGITNTCFKYFQTPKRTWIEASSECRRFTGGIDRTATGHLARVDNELTNTFVQGLVPGANQLTWIGLHYSSQALDLRWDGFLNEVPEFTKFESDLPGDLLVNPNVYMKDESWAMADDKAAHSFVCQHDAFIAESKVTCPKSPIKMNNTLDQPMSCEFSMDHWSYVVFNFGIQRAAICHKVDQKCYNVTTGFTGFRNKVIASGVDVSLNFTRQVFQQQQGTWTCLIYTDRLLDSRTCELEVYEPSGPVNCTTHLSPESLTVDCRTDRIYPEAVCLWSYKYLEEEEYQLFSDPKATRATHPHIIDNGNKYFQSNCSLEISADRGPKVLAGQMFIQILVYPDINNADSSFFRDVGSEAQASVTIELPEEPVFRLDNDTTLDPTRAYLEGDEVRLRCEVNRGIPLAVSTTLACAFNVSQSGERTLEVPGNSIQLNATATPEMDGETCVCWGNHITGRTRNASITFHVIHSARVNSFTVNDSQTNVTFDLNDPISLACQTSGNPLPLAAIFRHGGNDSVEQMIETIRQKGVLTARFPAKCSDNGNYECRAQNVLNGTRYNQTMEAYIRVNCQPTLCANQGIPVFQMRPDTRVVISLCVSAYPAPDLEDFMLEKGNGQDWTLYKLGQNDSLHMSVFSGILESVTVTIYDAHASDTGNYRLSYRRGSGSNSTPGHIAFRLAEPHEDSDSDSVVAVVVPLVFVFLVLVVVVVIVVVRRWRRSLKAKKDRTSYQFTDNSNTVYIRNGQTTEMNESDWKTAEQTSQLPPHQNNHSAETASDVTNPTSNHGNPKPKGLHYMDVIVEPSNKKPVSISEPVPNQSDANPASQSAVQYTKLQFEAPTEYFNMVEAKTAINNDTNE